MDDYTEDSSPELESNEDLMSEPEEDGPAPELSEPEEPAPEPLEPSESEPEETAPEPESPEEPGEPEPETPPSEESGSVEDSDRVQDLIDAIGDLNETITGAVTEAPEELPAEETGNGAGGGSGGDVSVVEPASVDLTPVVRVLEKTNELLEQQSEVLVTQHNDLLQLQANVNFVFLAVFALIGVVLGVAVGKVFHDLWRA